MGTFFRETISARFDEDTFAVDYAEQLFSEELEPIKYHKALNLCHKIFSCRQEDISSSAPDIIALAQLVYPKEK